MGHKVTRQHAQVGNHVKQSISIQSLPIPEPELLERLEEIKPGITQLFMDIASKEQEHRHAMEAKAQRRAVFALRFAFAGLIITSGLSAFAFYKGYPTQGASVACTVIVSGIIAFLGGRNKPNTINQ